MIDVPRRHAGLLRRGFEASRQLAASGTIFAGEALAGVFGFGFGVLGARSVGLREYGYFGIASAAAATALIVLDVRLEDLVLRRFQEHLAGKHDGSVWSGYLWGDLAFGLLRFVLLVAPVLLIPFLRSSAVGGLFVIVVAGSALSSADPSVSTVLNAQGRRRRVASSRVVPQLAALLGVLLFRPRSAMGLATISAVTPAFGTAVLWTALVGTVRAPSSFGGFVRRRSEWLRTVVLLSAGSTLRGPAANLDQLIVGGVLGPTKAGIYRLAKSFSSLPGVAAASLRFAETPRIMAAAVRGDQAGLRHELARLTVLSTALGGLATIAWLALGRSVLHLVGPAFGPVYLVAALLFVAGTLDYATSWSKTVPVILDRPRWALIEGVIYLVLTPPAIFAGTKVGGLTGTALIMIAITTTGSIAWIWTTARRLQ